MNNTNIINDKKKLFDRLSKYKVNKSSSFNIIRRENKLRKSNSTMDLLNKNMRLEKINNEKIKK
jgi:hypothetical protein